MELRRFAFGGFDGVRDVQSQLAELDAQGLPGDSQQSGGLMLIAPGVLENASEQHTIDLAVRVGVNILSVRGKTGAEERLQIEAGLRRCRRAGSGELRQEGREQDRTAGLQQGLFEDAL